jgi:hypothetical protein
MARESNVNTKTNSSTDLRLNLGLHLGTLTKTKTIILKIKTKLFHDNQNTTGLCNLRSPNGVGCKGVDDLDSAFVVVCPPVEFVAFVVNICPPLNASRLRNSSHDGIFDVLCVVVFVGGGGYVGSPCCVGVGYDIPCGCGCPPVLCVSCCVGLGITDIVVDVFCIDVFCVDC